MSEKFDTIIGLGAVVDMMTRRAPFLIGVQMSDFEFAGTISHGTLNPDDLIPRFSRVLKKLAPDVDAQLLRDYIADPSGMYDADQNYVMALEDALEALAPADMYFGTLEGDGSDFGFWEIPDENEDNL